MELWAYGQYVLTVERWLRTMASKKGDPRLSRKYKEIRLKKLAMDGWVLCCTYEAHG